MTLYLAIKFIHIVSACILLGTGAGIAFFMLCAHITQENKTFLAVSRMVVLADWIFTAPAVVIQFFSGLWLTHALEISYHSLWFVAVIGLFLLVGFCWIPVVWIQIRLTKLALHSYRSAEYSRLMNLWIALGIPAFLSVIALLYLMLTKAGIGQILFE